MITIPGVESDELRIEWDVDGNAIYMGTAKPRTLASGLGWNLYKFEWLDGNCIYRQHRIGIWDDRATLDWL